MNPRFKGCGLLFWIVLPVSYIPLRMLLEASGNGQMKNNRPVIISLSLAVSGTVLFLVAALQDKRAGIDPLDKSAWTSQLFESQHICFHIPMRLVAAVMILASLAVQYFWKSS